MKRSVISIVFAFIFVSLASAQTFQWAHTLGLSNRSRAFAIANDSTGNVYTLGIDRNYTQSIIGKYPTGNLLLEKRSANGDLQWAKTFPGHAGGLDIAATANGTILITGAFYDSLYFGGDTLKTPWLEDRMFLAGFSSDGTLLWQKADSSQWGEIGVSITVSGASHFFVTGISQDIEGLLRKYDLSGETVWEKKFTGVRNIDDLVEDAKGNLYISGTCNAQADFDGIALPPDTAAAQYISYVAKLDPDGKAVWLHANTYTTFDISTSLAFDNLGFLCRIRNGKDFMRTIFEVIEPNIDSVLASWQFPQSSSTSFDRSLPNLLTSTGSSKALFGPYYAQSNFDTTVIYQLRYGISTQGMLFFIDTLAVIHGRGLRLDALSLTGRILYLTGCFTDSVLHLGQVALANTNDFAKYETDQFVASLALDDAASVAQHGEQQELFRIFPNPSLGDVMITFDYPGERLIEIYNTAGILVQQITCYTVTETITLHDQPSGVYTAVVHDNAGKTSTMSFVHRH